MAAGWLTLAHDPSLEKLAQTEGNWNLMHPLLLACWTLALAISGIAFAQQPSAEVAARAFESYEAVRTALAADKIDGISDHASSLIPLAEELAGSDVAKAGQRLSQATDLKSAREAFGVISKALVPKFLEAKLPDVVGFQCSMVKLPWAQRGERVQNPYMGKSMSTCGERIRTRGRRGNSFGQTKRGTRAR